MYARAVSGLQQKEGQVEIRLRQGNSVCYKVELIAPQLLDGVMSMSAVRRAMAPLTHVSLGGDPCTTTNMKLGW